MNGICENSLYSICRCKNGYHLPIASPLYDGHCHVDLFFRYGLDKNNFNAYVSNGRKIILIDNRHQYYRWFIDYELKHPNVTIYTTFGIHPNYLPTHIDDVFKKLEVIFKNNFNNTMINVGIGECGLDETSNYAFELQLIVFRKQLKLAFELNLPIVLHGRGNDAFNLMFHELTLHLSSTHKIHWHCVNQRSNLDIITRFLNHFKHSYIGINCSIFGQDDMESQNIFYKWLLSFENILSRIIIETGYPFLKPSILQYTQYNPISGIICTAQQLVNILRKKNINATKIIDQSNKNIQEMYRVN
ncbi:unnamed protein product [Rotaria sordida]|uniref:Uncharacterized protein n=1 Tax=Rotaria sordida TaxID=392033 RepID=A0A819TIH3_9BILA|nr:unnamed protein product [Rotaria sordida]